MTLDPDLLRQAWPYGYLLRQGLKTFGGWMYVGGGADISHYLHIETHILGYLRQNRFYVSGSPSFLLGDQPDLLPLVDVQETASWAVLKAELARAAWPGQDLFLWPDLAWTYWDEDGGTWDLDALGSQGDTRTLVRSFSGIATKDPAEALVLALVQLRQHVRDPELEQVLQDASTPDLGEGAGPPPVPVPGGG